MRPPYPGWPEWTMGPGPYDYILLTVISSNTPDWAKLRVADLERFFENLLTVGRNLGADPTKIQVNAARTILCLRPDLQAGLERKLSLEIEDGIALEPALAATQRIRASWVITSDSEKGFWSNRLGWVGDLGSASHFARHNGLSLPRPQDAAWTRFRDAHLFHPACVSAAS